MKGYIGLLVQSASQGKPNFVRRKWERYQKTGNLMGICVVGCAVCSPRESRLGWSFNSIERRHSLSEEGERERQSSFQRITFASDLLKTTSKEFLGPGRGSMATTGLARRLTENFFVQIWINISSSQYSLSQKTICNSSSKIVLFVSKGAHEIIQIQSNFSSSLAKPEVCSEILNLYLENLDNLDLKKHLFNLYQKGAARSSRRRAISFFLGKT